MTGQNTRYQRAQFARHIALVEFCHSPRAFCLAFMGCGAAPKKPVFW